MDTEELTLHHAPNSRSTGSLTLLEELGVPYRLHVLGLKAGDNLKPDYLAVNPLGKVPAVTRGGVLVTEQVAVFIYLADLFPAAGLAPALDDPLRGPYLRWMAFYGSAFEPALIDKSQKHVPPRAMAPYGDYDTTVAAVIGQLEKGTYLLGDRFTAVDVLWGTALRWTTMFGLMPDPPVVRAYIERVGQRPAAVRARAKDAELASQLA